ncbi:GH25017 [Drosophila grimshawi]|uniref:GH25017 n=1 Tax=Drosophila grimshawi TaxID=7222 RepID=B4JZ96_DROGR|nr:GH25017 [Drosophila grimshawi]
MWPQTLEMSRDECRGMLRRLELESYSHLVSVFRAQGSLSEPKAKLLEELRQMFHITQERHRAEVRRATNDEQLCTIAENVCGPNTWQEWSREGRRPYPLLPRISPQTALAIVANDLAAKAYAENAKLAAPGETGASYSDALLDQATYSHLRHGMNKRQEPHVVMDEPFKVPDLPSEIKKATLKRKENDAGDAKPNKRRSTHHDKQHGQTQQLSSSQLSAGGKDEDGQMAPLEQRPSARTLQQRYFYQQQQKHKQRMASKKGPSNRLGANSGVAGVGANTKPAKSGRRRAQKQLQQQMQQKQQQHQQQEQHQHPLPHQQHKVLLPLGPPPPAGESPATAHPNANHLVQPHVEYILDEALKSVAATKLKTIPAARVVYGPPEVLSPTSTRAFINSPIVFKEKLSPTPQAVAVPVSVPLPVLQQQLSTPVKKYIVEERQSIVVGGSQSVAAATTAPANVSTANLPLAPQIISVQQIAAPPKLRTTSTASGSGTTTTTTILPTGTKLTPKKINLLDKHQLPSMPNTASVRILPIEQQQTAPISIPAPSISNLTSSKSPATAATVQKYIVDDRVPSQGQSITTPLSSSASAVNIIKNIPASSLNNTLITPLSSATVTLPVATPLFRKASATTTAATTTAAGGGSLSTPQILGNIKLTSGSAIKHVPSSALRNIKICSPNGKVFLQPAKLHAGSIIHKLNTTNVGAAGSGGVTVSSANLSPTVSVTPTSPQSSPQRITIQKMQLLTSTQMMSSAGGSVVSSSSIASGQGAKVKPTTLTLSSTGVGKNNLVFLPTSGMRAVTLASSKPKSGAELLAAKPNVLVIGPSSSANVANNAPQAPQVTTPTSILGKTKAHQLITEDTPIDIINMPIIVADNGTTETTKTTVKAAPMMVLNATDWEMELDQASKATAVTTTTPTTTISNDSKGKQSLDDAIMEHIVEELKDSNTQLKHRIIELHDDADGAIEYMDMELEQPIEIECTSNISPDSMTGNATRRTTTTTTSLKATIVPPLVQEQKKLVEATTTTAATGAAAGAAAAAESTTMKATTF